MNEIVEDEINSHNKASNSVISVNDEKIDEEQQSDDSKEKVATLSSDSKNNKVEVRKFHEIDDKNYYSSMNYKIKNMFNNSNIVRPNYNNTVLIRE